MSSDRALLASVLFVVCLVPGSVRSQQAVEPEPADEARRRFTRGVALARANDCEDAVIELEASIRLEPRASTYFNLARCEERLEHIDRALRAYEAFAVLAEASHPNHATAEARMRELRARMGVVRVEANVESEIWLGERMVGHTPADVVAPAGLVTIRLRAEGRVGVEREVMLAAGTTMSISVSLDAVEAPSPTEAPVEVEVVPEPTQLVSIEVAPLPAPPENEPRARRIAVLALGTSSGAGLVLGATFGTLALVRNRDGRALDPYDATARFEAAASVRRASRVADVAFGAALVMGSAAVVVAVVARRGHARDASVAIIAPSISRDAAGALLAGRF